MFQGLRKKYLRNGLIVGIEKGKGLLSKKRNHVFLCSLAVQRMLSMPRSILDLKKPKEMLFNPNNN